MGGGERERRKGVQRGGDHVASVLRAFPLQEVGRQACVWKVEGEGVTVVEVWMFLLETLRDLVDG